MRKREALKRAQAASNRQQRRFVLYRALGHGNYGYGPLEENLSQAGLAESEIVSPNQIRMPQGMP